MKTIAAEFQEFSQMALNHIDQPALRDFARMVFYAGSISTFKLVEATVEEGDEDKTCQALEAISQELEAAAMHYTGIDCIELQIA